MTQAIFEVQTYDGDGWVTQHRGADVDAAGEAARRALPDAKKRAVRIVKQSYDPAQQRLDHQVVFSLGKPRNRGVRRAIGAVAALGLSAAALVGGMVVPSLDSHALLAVVESDAAGAPDIAPAAEAAASARQAVLATLTPAAGQPIAPADGFDCAREAANGLVRATNISPARDRLYGLCAEAVRGDAAAQVALAARLVAGDGAAADPAQAVRWLQEAARAGFRDAYRPLGDLLTTTDPARAIAWYHRAATDGDAATARMLAERYRAGDGVDADARIALSYELMAAEAGDAAAMMAASAAFRDGVGTDINAEAAQRWLARAAAAGAPQAVAAVEGDLSQPLHWAAPAEDGGDHRTATGQIQAEWNPPVTVSQLLSVPPLHLELDGDANEVFSSFSGGVPLAAV